MPNIRKCSLRNSYLVFIIYNRICLIMVKLKKVVFKKFSFIHKNFLSLQNCYENKFLRKLKSCKLARDNPAALFDISQSYLSSPLNQWKEEYTSIG